MDVKRDYILQLCLVVIFTTPGIIAQLDVNVQTNEQFQDLFLKEMKNFERVENSCEWGTYFSAELQTCRNCTVYCSKEKTSGECKKCDTYFNEKKISESTLQLTEADDIMKEKIKNQEIEIQKLQLEIGKQKNSTQTEISQLKEDLQEQKQINQDQNEEIEKIKSDRERDLDKSQKFENENQLIHAKLAEFKVENKTLQERTGRLNNENAEVRQIAIFAIVLSIIPILLIVALVVYVWLKTPIFELQGRQKCHYHNINPQDDIEAAKKPILEEGQQQPDNNQAPNLPQNQNIAQPDNYDGLVAHEQTDVVQE